MAQMFILALLSFSAIFHNVAALGKVVWSVNAGGDSHTDSFGIYYARDTLRVGTASDYGKSLIIQRVSPQDMILYQTERYHSATFGYDIPIKEDGQYVLVLKFSEVWFAASHQKVFDVLVNGEHVVVPQLDIYAKVGRGVAHDEIIPFEISGGSLKINGESSLFDGVLSVEFTKTEADNPKINAIYVMKGSVDDVPKLNPLPSKPKIHDEFDDLAEEEEPAPVEEEKMSEEDEAMLQHQKLLKRKQREAKLREEKEEAESKRRSHVSGRQAADPFETEDSFMSSTFLPIVAAVFAFIPLIVCLWRL